MVPNMIRSEVWSSHLGVAGRLWRGHQVPPLALSGQCTRERRLRTDGRRKATPGPVGSATRVQHGIWREGASQAAGENWVGGWYNCGSPLEAYGSCIRILHTDPDGVDAGVTGFHDIGIWCIWIAGLECSRTGLGGLDGLMAWCFWSHPHYGGS